MPGTALRDVKRAVMDGLAERYAALPAFNGSGDAGEVVVRRSYRFGDTQVAQHMYGGRARGATPPAAIRPGRNFRDEVGRFDVNILLRIPGLSADEAEDRMHDIGVVLEEWVGDRKSNELGVAGLQSLMVERWQQDYYGVDRAVGVIRTYTIKWTARLT